MTKYTIFPKIVKVFEITYGRQLWGGVSKHVEGRRLIIGKYYVAEHSKTPGLKKGDAFVIDENIWSIKIMELERVTARQVQELYELGFPAKEISIGGLEKIPCTYIEPPKGYTGAWCNSTGVINPTLDEVSKWFRDEKGIQIILRYGGNYWWCEVQEGLKNINRSKNKEKYEEALSSGIDYAIEHLRCKISKDELIGLLNKIVSPTNELNC